MEGEKKIEAIKPSPPSATSDKAPSAPPCTARKSSGGKRAVISIYIQ